MGFLPGQKVADLGSGSGHYTSALSRALGPEGRVFAVDLDEGLLVRLKNESAKAGARNVEVIWGDIEKDGGTKLKSASMDGAVFSNLLFQLSDVQGAVNEAKRILKPGGKLCVVEWADLSFLSGVMSEHKREPFTADKARSLFVNSGFTFEKLFEAGEHHYGHIYKLPIK